MSKIINAFLQQLQQRMQYVKTSNWLMCVQAKDEQEDSWSCRFKITIDDVERCVSVFRYEDIFPYPSIDIVFGDVTSTEYEDSVTVEGPLASNPDYVLKLVMATLEHGNDPVIKEQSRPGLEFRDFIKQLSDELKLRNIEHQTFYQGFIFENQAESRWEHVPALVVAKDEKTYKIVYCKQEGNQTYFYVCNTEAKTDLRIVNLTEKHRTVIKALFEELDLPSPYEKE